MNAGAAAAATAAAAGGGATAAIHIKAILSPPTYSQPASLNLLSLFPIFTAPYDYLTPTPTQHHSPFFSPPPNTTTSTPTPIPIPGDQGPLGPRGQAEQQQQHRGRRGQGRGGLMVIPYRDSVLTFLLKGTSHELRAEKKPKLAR